MLRRPPGSTRTDTLFPYTTLFRSCEELREDGSDEAGIVELDREIGAVIAGPLAPGRTDLRIADIDPVAGRIAAGLFVRDDANRFGLNRESDDLAPEFTRNLLEAADLCHDVCSFHFGSAPITA